MKRVKPSIEGLMVIEPSCFQDERGFFLETFQEERYKEFGIEEHFVQENHSRSKKGVLRGMHFQVKRPQAQIVTVMRGSIFDVCVDIRLGSRTFGQWYGVELRDDSVRQIYMAPGFAHGFCVLSEIADLHYKVSQIYDPLDEGGLNWSDKGVDIQWPQISYQISSRDGGYPVLNSLSKNQLPATN